MNVENIASFQEDADGDLTIPVAIVTAATAISQELKAKFQMFRGEHFLDKRLGIPYRRDVLKKNADMQVVRALYRSVLLKTQGVGSLPEFTMVRDTETRHLSVAFAAKLTNGEILRSQPAEFIVSGG